MGIRILWSLGDNDSYSFWYDILFQKTKMALRFILSMLSTIFISCQSETRIKLDERVENTRETLLSHIPIGSNDMLAKKTMEDNIFSCKYIKKGEFLEKKNIDFLYCDREDQKGFLISRRWQIAIILKNNIVEDIQVSTGLSGP